MIASGPHGALRSDAIRHTSVCRTVPPEISLRSFSASVVPVEVRSTTKSATPEAGAPSVAPLLDSTSEYSVMPLSAKKSARSGG